ncbi:lysozyme 1-like [Littorina saxatilis]|uniref:Uncharacterized protein n=1 Tax=Littorina saxatilis TaxID=31220 RepID=A0AAN9FZI5_9CAEN
MTMNACSALIVVLFSFACCMKVASADSKCHAKSGTCQETNSASCGGVYERRLCSGSSTRVCCVPISGGGCTAEQKRLACQLRDSSRVVAFATHVSQISDNATPDKNLNDMCTGGRASRSSYKSTCSCSAPGGSICLHEKLLRYLVALQSSGKVTINELAGGCHSCKSFHYAGFAVDLNRRDGRTPEYTTKCRQMGGKAINEGTHLHCQF